MDFIQDSSFVVITFLETPFDNDVNTFECVPKSWVRYHTFYNGIAGVFWPWMEKFRILKLIKNNKPPCNRWHLYSAKIIHSANTFEEAIDYITNQSTTSENSAESIDVDKYHEDTENTNSLKEPEDIAVVKKRLERKRSYDRSSLPELCRKRSKTINSYEEIVEQQPFSYFTDIHVLPFVSPLRETPRSHSNSTNLNSSCCSDYVSDFSIDFGYTNSNKISFTHDELLDIIDKFLNDNCQSTEST